MIWLIIAVALLLVIGPVLYLLPSRQEKDQRLYRDAARAAGLTVELAQIYKIESESHERVSAGGQRRTPRIPCARYGLPQAQPLSRLPEVHQVRGRTLGWQPDPEHPDGGNAALLAEIAPFLEKLPATARGLSITPSMLWLYWIEAPGNDAKTPVSAAQARDQVTEIADHLKALRATVAGWHARTIS